MADAPCAREQFGCTHFYAEVAESNVASARSLERVGFLATGDSNERYPNGERTILYERNLPDGSLCE